MKIFRFFLFVILVLGAFAPVSHARADEIAMNVRPASRLAESATVGLNGLVRAVAVSGTNVYVGGDFTDAFGIPAADYIVMWDGTSWNALREGNPGNGSLNGSVHAIAVNGMDVYVGGEFTDVIDAGALLTNADYIVRFNGHQWVAMGNNGASNNGSIVGTVAAIAVSGTDVYVGGNFINVNDNGTVLSAADYLARWDGTDWFSVGVGSSNGGSLNNAVYALATSGGNLYVGGKFLDVNNNGTLLPAADLIVRWNGSSWFALGNNGGGGGALYNPSLPLQQVNTIAILGSEIYVGGTFTDVKTGGTVLTAADYIAKWDGSAWSALGSDGNSDGALKAQVRSIAISGLALFVGGDFIDVAINGTTLDTADYLARWDGFTWSAVGDNGTGNGSLNSWVYAVAPGPYVGGNFTNVTNHNQLTNVGLADRIAYYDGTDWLSLSASLVLDQPALDFGVTELGSSKSRSVTITNLGKVSLYVSTLTINNLNFYFSSLSCNGNYLPSKGSCTVSVVFEPLSGGPESSAVIISSAALNSPATLPLSGTGVQYVTFQSSGAQDGWILETGEKTGIGGSLNAAAPTFRLGDDAAKKQYRAILSFNTASLADDAVITRLILIVKRQGITGGGNPVSTFQGFMVELKKGTFGTSTLQATDFKTLASKTYGPFNIPEDAGGYAFELPIGARAYINKSTASGGLTQIRLRFKLDDNNNAVANYLSLYSGNAPLNSRPRLIVEYYVP